MPMGLRLGVELDVLVRGSFGVTPAWRVLGFGLKVTYPSISAVRTKDSILNE